MLTNADPRPLFSFPRLSRGTSRAPMVVLEYEASANAPAPTLPTFASAPFFYDRVANGVADLTDGALLADAKHTQSHSHPNVSYYYSEGVSDYVRPVTHAALRRAASHETSAPRADQPPRAGIRVA